MPQCAVQNFTDNLLSINSKLEEDWKGAKGLLIIARGRNSTNNFGMIRLFNEALFFFLTLKRASRQRTPVITNQF
jgi:hypothetical protein